MLGMELDEKVHVSSLKLLEQLLNTKMQAKRLQSSFFFCIDLKCWENNQKLSFPVNVTRLITFFKISTVSNAGSLMMFTTHV